MVLAPWFETTKEKVVTMVILAVIGAAFGLTMRGFKADLAQTVQETVQEEMSGYIVSNEEVHRTFDERIKLVEDKTHVVRDRVDGIRDDVQSMRVEVKEIGRNVNRLVAQSEIYFGRMEEEARKKQ